MKKQIYIISTILIGSFTLLSMTLMNTDVQEPWKAPAKYEKMANPHAKDADAGNIGKMLYSKHCKSCHGSKGFGDGTKADSIDSEMPDFTTEEFGKQSDGALYYKTFIGRDDMPSFSKKITDKKDQWLLVNYIKKF